MEFELPKINVSFEYDEEKDEIVFVINGVEKRVKTEDMITEMEKLQEQNTALEQEPCEDCISRQQAIDKMQEMEDEDIEAYGCAIPEGFEGKRAIEALKTLPSIQPKPNTGHWIKSSNGMFAECSDCGKHGEYGLLKQYKYCPNCGAKMESEEA